MDKYMININIREDDEVYQEEVYVEITPHAWDNIYAREIEEHSIYAAILAMGERILEFKCNQEFIIVDKDNKEAIVCGVGCEDTMIVISIITVIDTNYVFRHDGQKILVWGNDGFKSQID